MIVTMHIPAATRRKVARDERVAADLPAALADGLAAACAVGAERIRALLIAGDLGLTSRNPGQGGLAQSIFGELTDRAAPEGVLGVRSDSPAARYAAIQERGGTIRPKTGRALAVPLSDEARRRGVGPRDPYWDGRLAMVKRPGRPPLLVEKRADRFIAHWVLVPSVTIKPTRWWSTGIERARPEMARTLADVVNERLGNW